MARAGPGGAWRGAAWRGKARQGKEKKQQTKGKSMKTVTATLRSTSPYSQSRYYDAPKLEKESSADYEKRTWRERLHKTKDGNVFMPPMAFKNCLSEAAKYLSVQIPGKGKSTYTKHFEAGVLVTDGLSLPISADDVTGEWLFVPADGKRGSGKRVAKCFPIIKQWSGKVTYYILDETITQDVFKVHLCEAGKFIGIGRFRPRNNGFYGRFEIVNLDWE